MKTPDPALQGARRELSVIVVSFNGSVSLAKCLASLAPQARARDVEIIVASNWHDDFGAGADLEKAFPEVLFVRAPDGTTIPMLRHLGIKASCGALIGLLEDDCEMAPDWCAAVLEAHQSAAVAIGGAVEAGPYSRALDWGVYFCEYGRYMLPFPSGPASDLPGNNVSYKREALEALPDSSNGFYDVFVHRRWAREGRLMRLDATIVVRNMNFWRLRHVTSVPFHHGRAFGGQRSAPWPRPFRAGLSVLALFLPLLAVARIMKNTLRRRRHLSRLFQAVPWIVSFTVSWSLGEGAGYLLGPGDSPMRWR